jgi:hypothetical protein
VGACVWLWTVWTCFWQVPFLILHFLPHPSFCWACLQIPQPPSLPERDKSCRFSHTLRGVSQYAHRWGCPANCTASGFRVKLGGERCVARRLGKVPLGTQPGVLPPSENVPLAMPWGANLHQWQKHDPCAKVLLHSFSSYWKHDGGYGGLVGMGADLTQTTNTPDHTKCSVGKTNPVCPWQRSFSRVCWLCQGFSLNTCQWPLSGVARVSEESLHLIG